MGIKLLHRLDDILECERGMGGRTVQKYIENPLLAPLHTAHATPAYPPSIPPSLHPSSLSLSSSSPLSIPTPTPLSSNCYKFDLRVWVLVTSFDPLVAWLHKKVYGRR